MGPKVGELSALSRFGSFVMAQATRYGLEKIGKTRIAHRAAILAVMACPLA